jgi:UDP-glucose 4-epimerase
MSEIIITGGAGYIGSHAVKKFLEKGHKVVVIDNLSRGFGESMDVLTGYGDLSFYQADLQNYGEVNEIFDKHQFECVLHFGALCLVNESMLTPEKFFDNNVYGTSNLLKAMKTHSVKNIIFSSTCAVYGESQYLPIDEEHPKNPNNPYGASKLMAENEIKWMAKIHGLNYLIFRYFNVCGASEDGVIGDSKKPSVLLLQNLVRGAMGVQDFELTCPKVDTPDSTPIRDYVDVNDLIDAHYLGYDYLVKGGLSDEINLGTGRGNSVEEIITQVENVLDVTIPRKRGESRKGESARLFASNSKARQQLGWEPKRQLKDSIEALKKWYTTRPNGYNY